MSVPSRRGPWWYYGRSEEGKSYAIHCRRPAGDRRRAPPGGRTGRGRGDPAGRERAGRGARLLRRRDGGGQPRPPGAGLRRPTRPGTSATSSASAPSAPTGRPTARRRWCPTPATAWPGPAGPTWSSTCASTRPCARTSCGATSSAPTRRGTAWSSRRPTGGSRSAPVAPATGRSSWSPCTAPTRPSGWPYRPTTRWPSHASSCRARRVVSTPSTTSVPRGADRRDGSSS